MPVIRVSWCKGKSAGETAKRAAGITERITRTTGTDARHIHMIFEDVKPSDRAGSGTLFG